MISALGSAVAIDQVTRGRCECKRLRVRGKSGYDDSHGLGRRSVGYAPSKLSIASFYDTKDRVTTLSYSERCHEFVVVVDDSSKADISSSGNQHRLQRSIAAGKLHTSNIVVSSNVVRSLKLKRKVSTLRDSLKPSP